MKKTFILLATLLLLASGALSTPARAEMFLDLYAGRARTDDARISIQGPVQLSEEVDFDHSTMYGLRFGGYMDSLKPLGLALDISHFEAATGPPDIALDIDLVPVSVLLMIRVPLLTDEDFPGGHVQPYIAAGPSAAFYELEIDLGPPVNERISDWDVDGGWDFRAGLAVPLAPNLALFGEYRRTRYEIDFEETEIFPVLLIPVVTATVDTTLETETFLAGVSLRF